MDSAKVNDWMQIIGIFALVASLIFVGLQMKQSQDIAIAGQYQGRTAQIIELLSAQMQSDQALITTGKRVSDEVISGRFPIAIKNLIEEEGPEAAAYQFLRYRSMTTSYDNALFQYEAGFMTEEAWLAIRRRLKSTLSKDIYAAMYGAETFRFRASFQDLCSELLAELHLESQ